MLMLLGVVGGLYEVGILAAHMFITSTKPPEEKSDSEAV
jgi:sec-independent protein translocase protein TatC